MIRIIVRTEDRGAAANVLGASADVVFKTFDVDFPELESYLAETKDNGYAHRQVVGAEKI